MDTSGGCTDTMQGTRGRLPVNVPNEAAPPSMVTVWSFAASPVHTKVPRGGTGGGWVRVSAVAVLLAGGGVTTGSIAGGGMNPASAAAAGGGCFTGSDMAACAGGLVTGAPASPRAVAEMSVEPAAAVGAVGVGGGAMPGCGTRAGGSAGISNLSGAVAVSVLDGGAVDG